MRIEVTIQVYTALGDDGYNLEKADKTLVVSNGLCDKVWITTPTGEKFEVNGWDLIAATKKAIR